MTEMSLVVKRRFVRQHVPQFSSTRCKIGIQLYLLKLEDSSVQVNCSFSRLQASFLKIALYPPRIMNLFSTKITPCPWRTEFSCPTFDQVHEEPLSRRMEFSDLRSGVAMKSKLCISFFSFLSSKNENFFFFYDFGKWILFLFIFEKKFGKP